MSSRKTGSGVSMDVLEEVAAALRVLAHPHRLKIVDLLMDRDYQVGELAEALRIPPNACSQHLNLMRAHGLLGSRREGRAVYYHVRHRAARNVIACVRKQAMEE